MPGRSSQSTGVQLIGALVAAIAIVGYVVFDWRFGGAEDSLPYAIGLGVAILAVGLTLYRWWDGK